MAGFKVLLDDNADLQNLRSPVITAEEQAAALSTTRTGRRASIVQEFLARGAEPPRHGTVRNGPAVCALVAGARDEMVAEIASARALDDGQIASLIEQLKSHFGKTVTVETAPTPTFGGVVVKIGSRMIDGSLRTKLNSLKSAMNEAP